MISKECKDFFNKNKDLSWTPDIIPPHLKTNFEKANWILNESNFGWIELDINIDIGKWKEEAMIATPYLVPHREDDNIGWNSACIHGIDISQTGAWTNYGYTDETTVPYRWTKLADVNPNLKKFWENEFPSTNYRRIRWMGLEAESAITPHSDMPGQLPGEKNFNALEFGVPVNIAVIHPTECYMVLDKFGIVPFKEGKAFIINIRNYHSVINFSKQPRMHIIGHSYGYGNKLDNFIDLVVRSYEKGSL